MSSTPVTTGSVVRVPLPGERVDGAPSGVSGAGVFPGSGVGGGPLTLSGFITDGSIARLCDEFARLTGVPIWLRDGDGRVIIPAEPDAAGRSWRSVDGHDGAVRAFELVGRRHPGKTDLFVAPLRLSAGEIGAIVMTADWGLDDPGSRRALERAVTLLASTAVESCEEQLSLRRQAHEMHALFRLSSLLVRAGDATKVLEAALDLALEVLRCDAGSIAVLEAAGGGSGGSGGGGGVGGVGGVGAGVEGAEELRHRASRGLSEAWLARTAPLSEGGVWRAAALQGEVVCVEDLQRDARVADASWPRREGLLSMIATGLLFQGRASGLIRLYSRTPRAFTAQDRGLLRSIADHVAMALAHGRLRALREEDQQIKRQVRIAADVQRRMLPQSMPAVEPFDIAARYAPSFHLGGDFYDAFVRRGQLALAVCDVVGKGVPAALLMSAVRASLRAHTLDLDQLDDVMSRVNRALVRDTLESEFATLWLGMADPATLRLTYCGAGHDPPLVFRVPRHRAPTQADVDELAAGGMVLGIDPSQRYQVGQFDLHPGDVLLAYTDGLSEATNFENVKFGHERIKAAVLELLRERPEADAAAVVEHLARSLRNYCGLKASTDDVTLLVLRVKHAPGAAGGASVDGPAI